MPEIVRTRTTRYVITWVRVDFLVFGAFRETRERHHMSVCPTCYNCRHPFQDDEMMGLAGTSKGNKLVCRACAETFQAELRAEALAEEAV